MLETIDEAVAEAMYRHVWPGDDPQRESVATFWDRVATIPDAVKRRFRFQFRDAAFEEFVASECDRIDRYTKWD